MGAPSTTRLVALVVLSLAALSAVTTTLAAVYRRERVERSDRHFRTGLARGADGDLAAAVDEYRAALALSRHNAEQERALAMALVSLGRLTEAENYLLSLLQRYPTDGAANRAMARVAARTNRTRDARAFYHRAIYGEWPADLPARRTETRLELIDYLRQHGSRAEVVAELLGLKAELPATDTALSRRAADLFVEAEAPEEAAEVLRAAAEERPDDVELLMQLADAESATGRETAARTALARALRRDPKRSEIRDRLAVVNHVLSLDPHLASLRLVERTRRARRVLSLMTKLVSACLEAGRVPSEAAHDVKTALQSAEARAQRGRGRADAELAEGDLDVADVLFQSAPACHGTSPEWRAAARVLERVRHADEGAP